MNDLPAHTESNGDPRRELLRAVRLCHPHWENPGRITFEPSPAVDPSWRLWKEQIFLTILHPQIEKGLAHCATGDWRALETCDAAIEAALPAAWAERSRRAGRLLVEGYTAPEKAWRRLRDRITAGSTPGHLATVVTLRAAVFSIAPMLAAESYLLLEAVGGLGEGSLGLSLAMVADCLPDRSREPFVLRAA